MLKQVVYRLVIALCIRTKCSFVESQMSIHFQVFVFIASKAP
jgi:hypothetical protein